jgi:hypothetical protein
MNAPHESDHAPAPPPLPARCPKCREAINPADAFCRFCGARQQVTDPFYYHPVWILVLALTVLGPFALALVWRSKRMDTTTKAVLAAIIVAYSIFTFYTAYKLCAILYEHFSLLNQII